LKRGRTLLKYHDIHPYTPPFNYYNNKLWRGGGEFNNRLKRVTLWHQGATFEEFLITIQMPSPGAQTHL
jgi:hypothetical protein